MRRAEVQAAMEKLREAGQLVDSLINDLQRNGKGSNNNEYSDVIERAQYLRQQCQTLEYHTSRVGVTSKTQYLYAFEAEVIRLAGGSEAVSDLFQSYPGLRDGIWVNAHMRWGQRVEVREAAAMFHRELIAPKLENLSHA